MNRPVAARSASRAENATSGPLRTWTRVSQEDVCLGPGDDFPVTLADLTVVELHVLHSRVCLQLDDEHLNVLRGVHPETEDRHQELMMELRARASASDDFREHTLR